MYEERRQTFSIKDIFLQLLFIILLVFILIWLFPTKGYLEKRLDGIQDNLKPLYTRLFTDNILTMKEEAKNYFTTPRLPQNVGDSVKMTLAEMYEKSLLLELVDSNNNACDANKSYVELTKVEDEYELKVTLSCSDKEAYIIEHLGCYDYCEGTLCSKKEEQKEVSYRYKYVLETGGSCSNYGAWSAWTTNKIEKNNNNKVETKTEKVFSHYEQVWAVVGYEDQKYTEKVAVGYSSETRTAYHDVTKVEDVPFQTRQVSNGGTWVNAGTTTSKSPLSSTSSVRYTELSRKTSVACAGCKVETTYTYKVEKWQTTYKTENHCDGYNTKSDGSGCYKYVTVSEPYQYTVKSCVNSYENESKTGCIAEVTKTKKVAKYGYVQGDAVYKNVTYYRQATRTCTASKVDYKWSTSENDTALKSKGYTLTGIKEAI